MGGVAKANEAPRAKNTTLQTHEKKTEGRLRDPFLPDESVRERLSTPSIDMANLRLQAILYHPSSPRALISGQVVGIGDPLYEFVVSEIKRDKVSIKRGTREYDLFLKLSFEYE